MATITTRILGTEREKTIATTILQFAIPCSAQIAVVAALLAGAGFSAMILYCAVIGAVLIATGSILHRLLPGESSPLLLDLPPMRFPRLDNIVRKTVFRSYAFMKEATPWFFAGALAVGIMQITGILVLWQNLLAPIVTGWLQLPRAAATAFVMGLVRRDFGAAGLYALALTPNQVVVALVTITLFVPCVASLMVMLKERGLKEALAIWLATWIGAFVIGGLVSQLLI
jgi:ferrous iron transport protein B